MTSAAPHEAPRGTCVTAAIVCATPVPTSIRRIRPSRKKPTERLSGDQNGNVAPSVPGSGREVNASIGRSHNRADAAAVGCDEDQLRAVGRQHRAAAAGCPDDAAGHAEAAGRGRRDEKPHDALAPASASTAGSRAAPARLATTSPHATRSHLRRGVATPRRPAPAIRRLASPRGRAARPRCRESAASDPSPGSASPRAARSMAATRAHASPAPSSARSPACRTHRRRRRLACP